MKKFIDFLSNVWYNTLVVKKANKNFGGFIMNDKFIDELYVLGVFDDEDNDECYDQIVNMYDEDGKLKCDCDKGMTCSAFCPSYYDCPYMDD